MQDRPLNGSKIGSWVVREKMAKHKEGFACDVLTKPRSNSSTSFSDVVSRACDTGDRIYTKLSETIIIESRGKTIFTTGVSAKRCMVRS